MKKNDLKYELGTKISPENQDAVNFVGTGTTSGLIQLELLIKEGMKPEHSLFELGSGALTGGIPMIRYLNKNKYCGVDPNAWLRESTLLIPENQDILLKNPLFYSNEDFKPEIRRKFDFIFAHSILNHAADWQFVMFLENMLKHMNPTTVILVSLLFADGNEYGNPGYGVWSDDIAPINATEWMSQDVIYIDGKPRGNKQGKINFKTKGFISDSCEYFKLRYEILENYTKEYTSIQPNEYHDWIRITNDKREIK